MAYKYGKTTKCKVANGQTRDEYECKLGYKVNSQSVSNNTSNVTLILQVRSIKSNYATYGHKQTTKIDGTSLSAKSFDMRDTNTWQTFGKRTITVTHKSDGSYSASKSGSFTTTASSGYSLKSGSASVTVKPATIPRASVPSLSNSNFSVGDTITIYTNRKSGSFTHTIEITCGSYSKTISSVGENTTWNTTDLYQYITTANSQTGTIKVTTYSGSTNVGSKSISFTANIKNSNPILNSYNAYDSNTITTALTGSNQKIIKGYSNITVDNFDYDLKNYAKFSRYEMSIGSKTTSTTGASMTINNVDTNVVNVSVRDSRNNIGSLATTIGSIEGLIEYSPIKINSIEVKRLNSHQGSDDPTGTATSLSFQGTFWNENFGLKLNSIKSIKYYYKKTTDNEYIKGDNTNILSNLTISEGSFSISNLDIKGDIEADTEDEEGNITYYGFDINNAYDIKIEMSDELSVYSAITQLPVGRPYIEVGEEYVDFKVPVKSSYTNLAFEHHNGTSIGFGVGVGKSNRGMYDITGDRWLLYANSDNHLVYANNGLYSPATDGAHLDNYANIVLNNYNDAKSNAWSVSQPDGTALFTVGFSSGSITIQKGILYHNGETIRCKPIYDSNNVTNATNMYITSNGYFRRTTNTSSKRYKTDIKSLENEELDPNKLYDLEVKQFKYKEEYQPNEKDSRYNKTLIGFIAEEMAEIFPIAVDYTEEGEIDNWNEKYIIPAMLKLIQEQKNEIEDLKQRVSILEK